MSTDKKSMVPKKIDASKKPNYFYYVLRIGYPAVSICLFLYSFTQVDLNLTLSRLNIWQNAGKFFQHIGYFERPLSTTLFCTILFLLFFFYIYAIKLIEKKIITRTKLWKIIISITVLLVLSYPAFSYDMFNYMFTAKTVLIYKKNPYDVIPLNFTAIDPWVNVMRWTHLPSAYTPVWILLTLLPFLLGFGYFLLILWNIKIMIACFYLFCTWLIGKILDKEEADKSVKGMAIFALNPLIIIECLVSGHNDIVMMAVALYSFYLFHQRKRIASFFILGLSVAFKLITACLVPVYFLHWKRIYALIAVVLAFVAVLFQREVLAWYFVWVLPFIALLPRKTYIFIISFGVSIGLLLRYVPFLYYGHWNDPVPAVKVWVTLVPIAASILYSGLLLTKTQRHA